MWNLRAQVSSVRNRWQRIEKGRKLREDGTELKNRCHACGQPKRGHICTAKVRGGPQVALPEPPMPSPVAVPVPGVPGAGATMLGGVAAGATLRPTAVTFNAPPPGER